MKTRSARQQSNPVYAAGPDTQTCSSKKVGSSSSTYSSKKLTDNPSRSPSHLTPKSAASASLACEPHSSFDDIDLWYYRQNPPFSVMQNTPSSQSTFYSMLTDQDQSIPTSPSRDLRRSPRHIKSPCLPSYQSTEQTHLGDTTVTTSRKRQHYDQIYNNRIQHMEDTSAKFSTGALQKKNALHMESPIPKVTSISNPVYAASPDTQRCSSTKVGSSSSICSSIKLMDNPSCSPSHQTPKHSASVPYECAPRSSFDDIDLWFYKQNPPLSNMQSTPSRATFHSRLTENDNQQYNMHILTSQSKTARRSPRHTKTSYLPSYQSAEQTHQDANPNENHSTATNCRTNLTQENSHHDKRSRTILYFEESSTDQISTEEQNEKYPILDEDSELKIHVILESLMWNDTIPENGGPILSRQILAALVPESTLVHSSVAGKTCRPINKTILLRIKGAVRYVYGKRRRGRKEFESLWSKCLTSIGHMCKTLRSKQIKSEIDGTKNEKNYASGDLDTLPIHVLQQISQNVIDHSITEIATLRQISKKFNYVIDTIENKLPLVYLNPSVLEIVLKSGRCKQHSNVLEIPVKYLSNVCGKYSGLMLAIKHLLNKNQKGYSKYILHIKKYNEIGWYSVVNVKTL